MNWTAPEHANIPSPTERLVEGLIFAPQIIEVQATTDNHGQIVPASHYLETERFDAKTIVNKITPFLGAPKVFWERFKDDNGKIQWERHDFRDEFTDRSEDIPSHNDNEDLLIVYKDDKGNFQVTTDWWYLDHPRAFIIAGDNHFYSEKDKENYLEEKRYKQLVKEWKQQERELKANKLAARAFHIRKGQQALHKANVMRRGWQILNGLRPPNQV